MGTMRMVCLFICLYLTSSAAFDPLLNVESCTESKLMVTTYNAANNGLIYIQGQGENCKQLTVEGVALYEFDFQQCGIQWEMLFKIVIQKNQGYQTGADKQIPIFCVADRSDIIVSNMNQAQDKGDDGGLNMTIKPSAFMTFYKVVSQEEVMGKEVKLSDTLIMALQLHDQWSADFDIKAKYCVASDIVIIDNYCATDTDLFPDFSRLKTGYLISQFGAFRATRLEGGSVMMNFTCILEVCREACEQSLCNGSPGWGRKRREATLIEESRTTEVVTETAASRDKRAEVVSETAESRDKRQAGDNFDIGVGGEVNIVEKYSDIQIITSETMCLNASIFIVIIVFLTSGVIGLGVTSAIFYRKWSAAQALAKTSPPPRNKTSVHRQPRTVDLHVQSFDNPYDYPTIHGY